VPAGELLPDGLDLGAVGEVDGNAPRGALLAQLGQRLVGTGLVAAGTAHSATTPAEVPVPMPLLPPTTTTLQPSKLPVIPGSPPTAEPDSYGASFWVIHPITLVAIIMGCRSHSGAARLE
jgi:hypothetical protein